MKYPMRREDRALTREQSLAVLDAAEHGVLSTVGADGTPYGIPLDFVRDGDTLILHGSVEGRKADNIKGDGRISFCVIGKTEVVPSKFTTRYESVIVSGRAEWIEDEDRKTASLMKLCERFTPDHLPAAKEAISKMLKITGVMIVTMETITGKANR